MKQIVGDPDGNSFSESFKLRADLNSDGKLNIIDLVKMKTIVASM